MRSFDGYWRHCVRDDEDRAFVRRKSDEVRGGGGWSAEEYREWVERRAGERAKEAQKADEKAGGA